MIRICLAQYYLFDSTFFYLNVPTQYLSLSHTHAQHYTRKLKNNDLPVCEFWTELCRLDLNVRFVIVTPFLSNLCMLTPPQQQQQQLSPPFCSSAFALTTSRIGLFMRQ